MRTARAIERRGSSVTFGKKMKAALIIVFVEFVLLVALVACRVVTTHCGASKLHAQLDIAEEARWRELVATVKKTNPEISEGQVAKGDVDVSILHTSMWVPFSFEAYSIVKIDDSMYEEEISAYWYTPWKVYKRRVLEHFEKLPPIWLE